MMFDPVTVGAKQIALSDLLCDFCQGRRVDHVCGVVIFFLRVSMMEVVDEVSELPAAAGAPIAEMFDADPADDAPSLQPIVLLTKCPAALPIHRRATFDAFRPTPALLDRQSERLSAPRSNVVGVAKAFGVATVWAPGDRALVGPPVGRSVGHIEIGCRRL
ncbi:hypothetical protein FJ951_27185 [Mesorhizobium sp. B2-2-3]|uniref:hypothetical protein n=1 Tax=Mesorhizobium sp. B2-2-3 TaxID=2589963 RepID=UPI00112C36E3|nr:hypothetical protein [Mesorhizobium sp. B2-2-3]TPM39393.1 hypothetical protein FJ951_27185 [Mesorhizobium sp. B2-2-3]